MLEFIAERYNYWMVIVLMMIGLYTVFQSNNLIKRLVGLSLFQTSVFLFYITLSKVAGGSAPILYGDDGKGHGHYGDGPKTYVDHRYEPAVDDHGTNGEYPNVEAAIEGASAESASGSGGLEDVAHQGLDQVYSNPLPHVLILTAIVVGVATLAVGLALVVRIREAYGAIEADEIRESDIDHGTAEAQPTS